jgi:phage-related protein
MQLTRNRFGKVRKSLAIGISSALLVSGIGASSAHADAATDAAIAAVGTSVAEVKTSVTAVNDNVKLLAAQVTTLQAAVATLIDSFGDQLTQIIETQTTLMNMLVKIQAQLSAQAKAAAKKK